MSRRRQEDDGLLSQIWDLSLRVPIAGFIFGPLFFGIGTYMVRFVRALLSRRLAPLCGLSATDLCVERQGLIENAGVTLAVEEDCIVPWLS